MKHRILSLLLVLAILCALAPAVSLPASAENTIPRNQAKGAAHSSFALTSSIEDGDEVIIYSPGHKMAIKNENDNNWYLVPEPIEPTGNQFLDPSEDIVWKVVKNADGTVKFKNGANEITCWVSGSYFEMTNNAAYEGADGNWIVTWTNGLAYIRHATFSNSNGPAYIECYYNSSKDKTNISAYSSNDPTARFNDYGWQFFVRLPCEHTNTHSEHKDATCLEKGYDRTVCSNCAQILSETTYPALGHNFVSGVCSRCGAIEPGSAQSYVGTPLNGIPAEGAAFIIYNAENGVAMSADTSGGKSAGVKADENDENFDLKLYPGTGVFKLAANGDGTYYITCGGRYLTCITANAFEFKNDKSEDAKWKIERTTGGYYIKSATKSHSSGPATIEVYNSAFSPYGFDGATNAAIFTMEFYAINDTLFDPDNDGYLGERPFAGDKPEDGDTVVIYNDNGGMCFGPQADDLIAPHLVGVASERSGNTLNAGNGSLIFTVHVDGSWYAFENNGKYLRCSENEIVDGRINNDETLFFDALDGDYSWWKLEEVTGGYILYNKTAKYRSGSVCIEYFSNSFSGWTYNGSTQLFAMRFFKVEDPYHLGWVLNPKMNIRAKDAYIGVDYEFAITLDELTKVTEIDMRYALDGGASKRVAPSSRDGNEFTFKIPKKELEGGKKLTLSGTATNEYGISYSASATVNVNDEPIILSVTPPANSSTGTDKRPTICANIVNCGTAPQVVMTLDGAAVTPSVSSTAISYKPAYALAEGFHNIMLTVTRADGKKAETAWAFFIGHVELNLYFGQIHSHTAEYSDGTGQLEDAYEHAMAADDVDFLIVTDHSNYFDTTSTATTSSYYDLSKLTIGNSLTKWEEARATAKKYDQMRSDFVCGYGYEMTWSGGPGHVNTYNTYGTLSRNNGELNNKTNYAGMELYYDLLVNANRGLDINGEPVGAGVRTKYVEDAPVVAQFNHPGTTFSTFDDYAGYTPARDTVLNLIEVAYGEGKVGGSSYWPCYSEYDKCLAKGWHVAPTNNQDNHKGNWGDANTCRTVILTDDFSEAGLYRAMAERRVYATEDQNLSIYYFLNGEPMGTIIRTGDTELDTVTIAASISDPDGEKLSKVEIIGENGIAVKTYTATGATFEINDEFKNTQAYYYVKVTEADGDIAVTAPVWVGSGTMITANIQTDSILSVVGEEETITATVTNGGDNEFKLEKVAFFRIDEDGNETAIKTFFVDDVVPVSGAKTFGFVYERSVAGIQEIKVVFYGECNGKDVSSQASMKQKVWKAEEIARIAVDYGHGNFYVSGGYSDSMGNFIKYCADNGVLAEFIQKGEFTYDNLKQYKMVVLTVPYDTGILSPSAYTREELDAIRTYAARGGNVIVCTKSDRKSPTGALNCAALTNSLLEAIGSNVRAANGIIVDNAMRAHEVYRLYFSSINNYNLEHRFTKGAYTASNAFCTIPSSSNSTGFQLYNAAPILINAGAEDKVTTLVRGYPTTWGASYEANFDGSSYVPDYESDVVTAAMGDVNVMTYEDLAGGGWLVTCGCCFFTSYDIKDSVDYSNKFIVRNILKELTDSGQPIQVTKIRAVKDVTEPSAATGEEYTIEGYVTSNSARFDPDTAFADCIYIQDKNGNGIKVTSVSGQYAIGMNVRVHGGLTFDCGEAVLDTGIDYNGYIEVINDTVYCIPPKEVNCKTAVSDEQVGNLLRVNGTVTAINQTGKVIYEIKIRDASGEACLFIDDYIMKDYKGLNGIAIGMKVSGVGIASRAEDESGKIVARLRVRDRSEIQLEAVSCAHEHAYPEHQDATCTEDGYDRMICDNCGMILTETVLPAPGHDFADGVCTRCGAADPDYQPAAVPGDINGDGDVDTVDAIRLARYLVGLVELTDEQKLAADVNGDGDVTALDGIRLAKHLVGLVENLQPAPAKATTCAAQ